MQKHEEIIEFPDAGKLTLAVDVETSTSRYTALSTEESREEASRKRMTKILEMLDCEEQKPAEVSRLIAIEIASVIEKMNYDDPLKRNNRSMRDLNDHVKALRELQRTLTESDTLSRKDHLDMDGPKFKFVFRFMIETFQKALKEANVDESIAKNVLLNFGDAVKTSEDTLRRELNKIDSGR
jgi:hypothetical protein